VAVGLADFIRDNLPAIAREWEQHAASLVPDKQLSRSVLRNGIDEMLHLVADEVERPEGKSQDREGRLARASERHATDRARMGIDTPQLLKEFCALRATVIRMWQASERAEDKLDIHVLRRFNEALDELQLVAAKRYHENTEQRREMFLAILGHDLRNPLAAVMGAAEAQMNVPERAGELAQQIQTSAKRMAHMVEDLVELTRLSQGKDMPVERSRCDMGEICKNVVEEMKLAYPDHRFELEAEQGLLGEWDEPRLTQVISNLMGNAVAYGNKECPIHISAEKAAGKVEVRVHNEGVAIPPEDTPHLFNSFSRGQLSESADHGAAPGLGLGLYIAKEIMAAHGGTIDVASSEQEGTTFTCRLPA
jgi:signal transduction histidine kinase